MSTQDAEPRVLIRAPHPPPSTRFLHIAHAAFLTMGWSVFATHVKITATWTSNPTDPQTDPRAIFPSSDETLKLVN